MPKTGTSSARPPPSGVEMVTHAATAAADNIVKRIIESVPRPSVQALAMIASAGGDVSASVLCAAHRRCQRVSFSTSVPHHAAIDTEMYKERHLTEDFDKTRQSFQAMTHLVAAVINSQ
jgi:hypothetical protein